ncbi:hypothetical protein Nans01_24980 [Nocardiopsis ansamitocini]|uniref:Uncharacterized protein n=1 Tax=Nocardiopsis ansamitocini TaxID=1670832 RepID=A0A9W6P6U9_9ACTN|nr:hypothetical protein Nans01_24980 [Nocardiopsis ansamitocini]
MSPAPLRWHPADDVLLRADRIPGRPDGALRQYEYRSWPSAPPCLFVGRFAPYRPLIGSGCPHRKRPSDPEGFRGFCPWHDNDRPGSPDQSAEVRGVVFPRGSRSGEHDRRVRACLVPAAEHPGAAPSARPCQEELLRAAGDDEFLSRPFGKNGSPEKAE